MCIDYSRTNREYQFESNRSNKKNWRFLLNNSSLALELLTNISAQPESLLHSKEQTNEVIGLNSSWMQIKQNSSVFCPFFKGGGISTLSNKSLKWVDQFRYLGSNILSTESDVNMPIEKAWTAIDGRCPWCNRYRRRKWTRRHEFKSWTRLTAFHIALIPLGKVWIQLFSPQLWVNSRTD